MEKSVVITVVVGSIILLLVAAFAVWLLFAYQKEYYRHLQEMNSIKQKYEQEILRSQLEIREQTMKHLSQEIHDNIGQVLSLANLQLTAIELEDDEFATGKINKSMSLVSKAIADLRDLSKSLNGENLAMTGLKQAVQLDLELIEKSGVFETSFEVCGEERRLDASKEIIVFRIVQEALNNIIKHSRANRIAVGFNFRKEGLNISIYDNGNGFDNSKINHAQKNGGSGLKNMISRAALIKADMNIETAPDAGTKILLLIPF